MRINERIDPVKGNCHIYRGDKVKHVNGQSWICIILELIEDDYVQITSSRKKGRTKKNKHSFLEVYSNIIKVLAQEVKMHGKIRVFGVFFFKLFFLEVPAGLQFTQHIGMCMCLYSRGVVPQENVNQSLPGNHGHSSK